MADTLSDLSSSLASAVTAAGAGVARVDARQRMPASGAVWSADGVIVTSHHVVERDENIQVGVPDGDAVPAALVGRDPTTDLAVLKAEASGLSPVDWAPADALSVGHLVLALGRPGRTVQATLGIASAVGKSWRTPLGGRVDTYLQTDVAMYPGFSGGPLVDASGRAVGINTTGILRGISLTIPGPTVRRVVEALLSHGRIKRGYIGVSAQIARLPSGLAEGLGQETGLLLVAVEPDSPAERAGLMLGDTLVSIEDRPVRHLDDLVALLSEDLIGKDVPTNLVRAGKQHTIGVKIGERTS